MAPAAPTEETAFAGSEWSFCRANERASVSRVALAWFAAGRGRSRDCQPRSLMVALSRSYDGRERAVVELANSAGRLSLWQRRSRNRVYPSGAS